MALDLTNSAIRSIEELLRAEDEQFVRLAYQAVLGRAADPAGLSGYLTRLRNGEAKRTILVELAHSPEARRNDAPPQGLGQLLHSRRGRFVRKFLRRIVRMISDDGQTQAERIRSIHNALHRHELASFERMARLGGQIQELSEMNRSLFAQLLEQQHSTTAGPTTQAALAETIPGHRIVFNLTTSRHWRSRAVGIVRVERELATHLLRTTTDTVFVAWDRGTQCLQRMSKAECSAILSDRWLQAHEATADFSNLRSVYDLDEQDIFVSVGIDWDLCPLHEIAATLLSSRCRAVFACHDLVPILFPEFCVEAHFDQRFKRHFVDMAHLAHAVISFSAASRSDVTRFWAGAQIKDDLPETPTIKLANLRAPKRLPRLPELDLDRLRHIKASSPYVLYVSSIEARKNHRLLLGVWRNLYRSRGAECPTLVFVGMAGWGTRDMLDQIPRMPAHAAGKIIVLNDVNDDLLVHLYSNCAFSVFPSLYEGWGLAATEALAFDKVCLIADVGGLDEATQRLMPKLHPLDFHGWQLHIERLLDDDSLIQHLQRRISDSFVHRDWTDFSTEFVACLHAMARRWNDAVTPLALVT